jgi:hypothetical protein
MGVWALWLVVLAGCGGPKPVTGGTPGMLTYRGKLPSDIRVTIHRVDGTASEPIGFGVTANDGTFQLVTNEARGPLRLSPGEYLCTLESVGSPIRIPREYTKPGSTPLKVSWSAADKSLDLDVPEASTP